MVSSLSISTLWQRMELEIGVNSYDRKTWWGNSVGFNSGVYKVHRPTEPPDSAVAVAASHFGKHLFSNIIEFWTRADHNSSTTPTPILCHHSPLPTRLLFLFLSFINRFSSLVWAPTVAFSPGREIDPPCRSRVTSTTCWRRLVCLLGSYRRPI